PVAQQLIRWSQRRRWCPSPDSTSGDLRPASAQIDAAARDRRTATHPTMVEVQRAPDGTRAALFQIGCCEIPVNQVPPRLDVLSPRVAVVDVIRVLPDVAGNERGLAVRDRRIRVVRGLEVDSTVGALYQPCPSAGEMTSRRIGKLLLEGCEIAEGLF